MSWLEWLGRFKWSLHSSQVEEDPERFAAAAIYPLLVDPGAWIHRRVESVEFIDDRLVRRRVSFDFTSARSLG